MYPKLYLKPKRDKPIRARHPWIFSGAIDKLEKETFDGSVVDIVNSSGEFLARGYFNSQSQIAARVLTWDNEPIDHSFFTRRIQEALIVRKEWGLKFGNASKPTNAFRLINSENDLLPGLVVDAYGDYLVVQISTLGMEKNKENMIEALAALLKPRGIYEKSDVETRQKEGLEPSVGLLKGEEPPELLKIKENGIPFLIDIRRGQKTGHYLDQRDNRKQTASLLESMSPIHREPLNILNAFSYTGSFGVSVAHSTPGVRILNIDSSEDALGLARKNFETNKIENAEFLCGNAFHVLRQFRDETRQFDAIILDPPKFAFSQAQLMSACRGYKDLNLLAFKLLNPGGYLITFSCSGVISPELFQKVVFEAAADAGRSVQILKKVGHPPDHPVLLSFPEGEYLKGLVVRVIS